MTEQEDNEIRRRLLKYRPTDPPESLRRRVMSAVTPSGTSSGIQATQQRPRRKAQWGSWLYGGAVAACLLCAIGLHLAAERTAARVIQNVGNGPARWTQQDEDVAQMLDGDGWGRKYLASLLMNESDGRLGRKGDMQ